MTAINSFQNDCVQTYVNLNIYVCNLNETYSFFSARAI